jgi:hypothetical protein
MLELAAANSVSLELSLRNTNEKASRQAFRRRSRTPVRIAVINSRERKAGIVG